MLPIFPTDFSGKTVDHIEQSLTSCSFFFTDGSYLEITASCYYEQPELVCEILKGPTKEVKYDYPNYRNHDR